jgi:hypothetical protein
MDLETVITFLSAIFISIVITLAIMIEKGYI